MVYKANHLLMDRIVAIKMLKAHLVTNPQSLKRFQQEAKAVSYLMHPNIVAVFDFGVSPDAQPYLVMDYLDGINLTELIEQQKHLEVQRSIRIFLQVCDALAHAHQKGVIHRDLKPSNIMLVKTKDQDETVKIVDFGIAKLMPWAEKEFQKLTQTGESFGSPVYMSPEQCLGEKLDIRSDIYSLGCLMYETLVGSPPHLGKHVLETMYKHLNEQPLPPSTIMHDPTFPGSLERIVLKALSKQPADRYQSMTELKTDLEQVLTVSEREQIAEAVSSNNDRVLTSKLLKVSASKSTSVTILLLLLVIAGVASSLMLFPANWQHTTPHLGSLEELWNQCYKDGERRLSEGSQDEAEKLFEKAIELSEKIPDEHRRYILSVKKLSALYLAQGRTTEARELTRRLDTIRSKGR